MGGYTIKRHIGTEEKPDVVIALTQAGLEKLIGFGEWGKSWVIEDRPERKQSFFQSAISKLQGVCVFGSKASSPKDLEKLAPDHPEQIKKQNLQEYLEEDERTTCSFGRDPCGYSYRLRGVRVWLLVIQTFGYQYAD